MAYGLLGCHITAVGQGKGGVGGGPGTYMLTRSPHPDPMLGNSPAAALVDEVERGPFLLAASTFPCAGFEYACAAAEPGGTAVCQGSTGAPGLALSAWLREHCEKSLLLAQNTWMHLRLFFSFFLNCRKAVA